MTEQQKAVLVNMALPLSLVFSIIVMVGALAGIYADGLARDSRTDQRVTTLEGQIIPVVEGVNTLDVINTKIDQLTRTVARIDRRMSGITAFQLRRSEQEQE